MAGRATEGPLHPIFTGWRAAALVALCVVVAVHGLGMTIDLARLNGAFGYELGGSVGLSREAVQGEPRWQKVTAVLPGGTAEASGIKQGDRIRFEQPWMAWRTLQAGQVLPVTVDHNGQFRDVELRVDRFDPSNLPPGAGTFVVLQVLSSLSSIFLGIFVLARGWGRVPALCLGFGVLNGLPFTSFPAWIASAPAAAVDVVVNTVGACLLTGSVLVPIVLYGEYIARPPRAWFYAMFTLGALYSLAFIVLVPFTLFAWPFDTIQMTRASGMAGNLLAAYIAWCGMRRSGAERDRFRAVFLAFAIKTLGLALSIAGGLTADKYNFSFNNPLLFIGLGLYMVSPLIEAWAVLRVKVIDLSFAFNRTLIFGVVSTILLTAFGILEWATHHLLPEEWAKASAWVDGGIALGLFLVFHRVRDFVEHRIEHWFFHDWQVNEAKLRRFVASAAHFEEREPLVRAFAAELARFAGSSVALYLRDDAAMDHAGGEWRDAPQSFASDDPAFALMRSERRPLDLSETATDLPGVLALPLLDHGALLGVALLQAKADGALYRPDEVEVLGWAAQQVGLDLAALRARHLERDNARLAAQVEKLSDLLRPPAVAA